MTHRTTSALAVLVLLTLPACGYPRPQQIEGKAGVYALEFCHDEEDCFQAADKVCESGYRITKYGSVRPEEFVCKQ